MKAKENRDSFLIYLIYVSYINGKLLECSENKSLFLFSFFVAASEALFALSFSLVIFKRSFLSLSAMYEMPPYQYSHDCLVDRVTRGKEAEKAFSRNGLNENVFPSLFFPVFIDVELRKLYHNP